MTPTSHAPAPVKETTEKLPTQGLFQRWSIACSTGVS